MVIIFLFFFIIGVGPIFSYLDPGTGSMALQAIIAAFLGFAFTMKLYWKKIIGFFKKDSENKNIEPDNEKKSG